MTPEPKAPLAVFLYKIISIAQTALCGLLTLVILYGISLPGHFSWALNVVMAVIVLMIGTYFFLRLRAFRLVSADTEGLSKFVGWDLVLQALIALVLAAAVMGAAFRVFGEGFAVFG
jgi:hypothetical protein